MPDDIPAEEQEYEILPHKEIQELKEELIKLKEFDIAPSKKLHVSVLELNTKLDKLISIFEDATHEMRIEEGGLNFTEKMKPLLDKMNKILEQNSEIASGILALADMVKELKEIKEKSPDTPPTEFELPEAPPRTITAPPPLPPTPPSSVPPEVPPGLPLPPIPPRKRTFGL